MNQKALRLLEYDKIILQLSEKASSAPGRKLCAGLLPETDPALIRQRQRQTGDALSRLLKKGGISFGGNKPLDFALSALSIGSSLSAGELLSIAGLLENVNRVKAYGRPERDDSPKDSLEGFFEALEPLAPLAAEIRRCLLSEEEVADDASPALKRIRRSMAISSDKIHQQLNHCINGSMRTYLQDAVITIRNNRYCIPVKAECKNQVPGMIHDQSSTGSTLFIEPASVVSLNNALKELELQEKEEIERILAALSAAAGERTQALAENGRLMTQLDFIFAKGALALEQNASEPLFNEEHFLHIRKGRHPLLPKKNVVPIDILLGKEFDLLIVTGPNTGGKTVSLKTLGLFTLMGQAGLHIPAAERSELSVFTNVFADIGDEQSIEQSLSTFSSHMTNIVSVLKEADGDSLCLFDELCAGTDPTEGAALAIAILSFLHDRGIRTMATTHYSELKVFALSTPFAENACCEFDVESLSPTYRLLVGIPGKSNAFAISGKLGLPEDIIGRAREQITSDKESFENLLASLEESRLAMEKEEREIAACKAEIKALKERLAAGNEKLDKSRERILRQANEEARTILQEAKSVADEAIRIFQKAGPNVSIRELEAARSKVRDGISRKNEKLALKKTPPTAKTLKPSDLKLGDMVSILSMGLTGTVTSLPDQKGNLFVQCGILRSQANIQDLALVDEPTVITPALTRTASSGTKLSKSFSISPEINLLGKTVDEALVLLDKYLDDAYLAHLPNVRIVHGKGTGALRKAVQNHLRRSKSVKSFRLGEFGEGDSGVTIAEFR